MGLLDSLMGDPETAGLLSGAAGMADASGPSLMPRSFGQVMSAGLRGSREGYNAAQDQQMRQLEMQMKHVGLQQALAKLSAFQQFNDGDAPQGASVQSQPAIPAPSSMQLGSGMADMAPAQPGDGQQAILPQSPMSAGANKIKALQRLALYDGKIGDAYNMQKDMLTGYKVDAGAYRMNPMTGQMEYMGDPTKGLAMSNGVVSTMPGFAAANAGIEGAKTSAVEQAKNQNTLLPLDYVGADNERIGGTVYDQIQRQRNLAASGPTPAAPAMPTMAAPDSADMSTPSLGKIPASVQSGRDKTAIALALQEVSEAKTPQDKAQAMAVYQQMVQRNNAGASAVTGTPLTGPMTMPKGSGLQSPAQAQAIKDQQEVAKADDLKKVNLNNDPNIKFKTDLLSTAHAANAATLTKLSDTVRSEFELQNRNKQLLPMLDKIQTGGFNPEGRIQFANALQTSGMVPEAAKKPLGEFLASGDPTTGKVLENQLAAAGIKTMLDTLDKEGKPNRAIFDAIHDAQESVKSGNGTLKQVFALQKQLYDMHYQQEQDMGKAMAAPDYNPLTMQTAFSKQRNESLSTPALNASKAPDSVAPPKQAVNMLRMNPKLAAQFDSKYGAGSAAQILGK